MKLNFCTIGDSNYFESIKVSVTQSRKFYKEAKFYIYDWGFTSEQLSWFDSMDNVHEVINWSKNYKKIDAIVGHDWTATVLQIEHRTRPKKLKGRLISIIKKWVLFQRSSWIKLDERSLLHSNKELILAQKPFCYEDCLKRVDGALVCLDGDAFIVSKIDDVLSKQFDVGITLRRMNEIDSTYDYCQVLNTGVLIFKNVDLSLVFVKSWISEMIGTTEYLVEQTSLTRMIEKKVNNPWRHYNNIINLDIDDIEVKVITLSCDEYNFNWIEEGIDVNKNKIIHFKGGRHHAKNFEKLKKKINYRI